MKKEEINILVVDDEEIMRGLFIDILEDEGCKVVAVKSGLEALEKIKNVFFDVIFIDVHMPGIDGMQTLREVKKNSPATIAVMTDSFPVYKTSQIKENGAIAYIRKPFNIEEVREIINNIAQSKNGG